LWNEHQTGLAEDLALPAAGEQKKPDGEDRCGRLARIPLCLGQGAAKPCELLSRQVTLAAQVKIPARSVTARFASTGVSRWAR
jgi:hypothetical protein